MLVTYHNGSSVVASVESKEVINHNQRVEQNDDDKNFFLKLFSSHFCEPVFDAF